MTPVLTVGILREMAQKKERTKTQEKKEKILRATLQLMLKKGSHTGASTTDICDAARIARPSLYHYFGSKRNLLLSIHIDHITRVLKPYIEKASAIDDPLERLTYMVRTFTGDVIGRYPELRFLIHDTLATKDRFFIQVRQEWKEHYLLLRRTIVELQDRNLARKEMNPSSSALFMLGMMTWVTFWLDYDRPEEVDKIADSAVEFVLRGLALGSLEEKAPSRSGRRRPS